MLKLRLHTAVMSMPRSHSPALSVPEVAEEQNSCGKSSSPVGQQWNTKDPSMVSSAQHMAGLVVPYKRCPAGFYCGKLSSLDMRRCWAVYDDRVDF